MFDRLLAAKPGQAAVDSIERGTNGVLVGWINGRPRTTPLIDVVTHVHCLDVKLLDLAHLLAQRSP